MSKLTYAEDVPEYKENKLILEFSWGKLTFFPEMHLNYDIKPFLNPKNDKVWK